MSNATVTGTTSENAATPMTGTSTRRISSVAYADEERLSEAKTASAVGLPSRSWASSSVCSGDPSNRFFQRYRVLSGTSSRRLSSETMGGGDSSSTPGARSEVDDPDRGGADTPASIKVS